jgi:hypothetical protein
VFAFYLDTRLIRTVTLVRRFQVGPAALIYLRCIGLHPAPDATGVKGNASFQQKFGDVLVGQRVAEVPRTHSRITSPGKWRPLNGLVKAIGMDFLRYQIPFQISQRNPRNRPEPGNPRALLGRRRENLLVQKFNLAARVHVVGEVVGD